MGQNLNRIIGSKNPESWMLNAERLKGLNLKTYHAKLIICYQLWRLHKILIRIFSTVQFIFIPFRLKYAELEKID